MKAKICFCPESVRWILRHLQSSSRETFRQMIKTGSVKKVRKLIKRKRRFSQKQLAAQRLFAKRARAGTLRRRR